MIRNVTSLGAFSTSLKVVNRQSPESYFSNFEFLSVPFASNSKKYILLLRNMQNNYEVYY